MLLLSTSRDAFCISFVEMCPQSIQLLAHCFVFLHHFADVVIISGLIGGNIQTFVDQFVESDVQYFWVDAVTPANAND